jgi:hypothetical protein
MSFVINNFSKLLYDKNKKNLFIWLQNIPIIERWGKEYYIVEKVTSMNFPLIFILLLILNN